MHTSFLKSLFLALFFGLSFSPFSLGIDPKNNDNTFIKNIVLLHQEDGSFQEKEYLTPQPPAPPINVPFGSTIQIELYGAEFRPTPFSDYTFITSWDFDSDFADSPSTKWNLFLNQELQSNIDPRDSQRYSSSYTKKFTFVFQTVQVGEMKLHFERKQTNSSDNFKPHGYDNLFFNIHVVQPAIPTVD